MKVSTAFGEVEMADLIHCYEISKKAAERKYEKRLDFLLSDEGKEWNRKKAKAYYEKNKEKVLAKRKIYNETKKAQKTQPVAPVQTFVKEFLE